MNKWRLPFLAVLCFVSESILVDVWPKGDVYIRYFFVPRFFLIFLVLMAVHFGGTRAMGYGFIFGFLYDVVYTELLGVYAFAYALIAYGAGKVMRWLHQNWLVLFLLSLLAVAVLDSYVYGIQLLIGRTDWPFAVFWGRRLWPTLLLNAVFLLVFLHPLERWMAKIRRSEQEE
ncbi:rod shape-determining protein MreD [Anoxybacillus geothermalis]|uniref:rod shape-determining protein MreD n=1 Tax=Geobacillus sp. DSP4a TaxID=2508873 RepID=UPI00067C1999|nr:rod shape-determining protein MreD [Geobacillus sp. LC300]MED0654527.1 rod shape-determining protein MreD [Anoxybacillus geothermalis]NNU98747.1 rod shape-determining protein MreD [Geobacillus sp. DSP4a]